MNTLKEIQEFLEPKKLAIAGASRDSRKFGGMVLAELKKKGFELFPVHPEAREIDGIRCFRSMDELPADVDRLYIVTPRSSTTEVMHQALDHGIAKIWIQQKSETPEALQMASENGVRVIYGRCILMFSEPVAGFHGFHRWLTRLFGKFPG